MIRRLLLGLGGITWGGISFIAGLYLTFPSHKASEFASWKVGELTDHEYAVDLGSLSPWIFPGAKATNVKVYTVKKGHKGKDEDHAPLERTLFMEADSVALRLQLIPRILGKWAVGFSARMYGGDIGGHYAQGATSTELSFDAANIDLTRFPIANSTLTLNLLGTVASDADLDFDLEEVKNSTGHVNLTFDKLGLADGSKISGFILPNVAFTSAKVAMEVKDGKVSVTEGAFESDSLTAALSGEINLSKKLGRSRCKLELTFTLPEEIDKLAGIAPDMKRARDKDGQYHFVVGGTVASPHVRPGRGGALASSAGEGFSGGGGLLGRGAGGASMGADGGDPDESAEDRRKRREERIKERRERMRKRREEAAARGDGGEGGPDEGGGPDEEGPNLGGPGDEEGKGGEDDRFPPEEMPGMPERPMPPDFEPGNMPPPDMMDPEDQ